MAPLHGVGTYKSQKTAKITSESKVVIKKKANS